MPRTALRALALCLALSLPAAVPAPAQEITQSHLQAALDALNSAGASKGYDLLLPQVAQNVTDRLIRMRADLHKEIADAVEAVALGLVSRRRDLNNDVARIWARSFTEDELRQISDFYKSPAGQKFSQVGPQVIEESFRIVEGWSARLTEEIFEKARVELKTRGVDF